MSSQQIKNDKNYFYQHEKYNEKNSNTQSVSANSIYNSAAVACDSKVGSTVGKSILEQGGSAVDAAIACLLSNSLQNAHSMGIGGGFFMLHYSKKDEKITCFDARESAPMQATADMFQNCSKTDGGLSVAVPGEIKGYWRAHQMFGNLSWNKLFQPAIDMCNNGFRIPPSQAVVLKIQESKILETKTLREIFYDQINNRLYQENSEVKIPKLAKTFEIIAKNGESAFYNGELSATIVDEIQSAGGIITADDLRNYECLVKEPVTFKLKNKIELFSVPPPSSGILLNFILALIDSYDSTDYSTLDKDSQFCHRFIEACKFSFGLRSMIGDSTFDDSTNLYKRLTDKNVINEYKSQINETRVNPLDLYGSTNFFSDSGTSHTSIIAPNGDAVAVTSSINLKYGSKLMGDRTNIIYNNQMDDFSSPDAECNAFFVPNYSINYIVPGKRPVSSMSPLIALDENKNVRLVCGSSGGTRIITTTALIAARNLLFDQNILQAVDDPRLHHQLYPDEMLYENHLNSDVVKLLAAKGHKLMDFGIGGSAIQAVERLPNGCLRAVCDHRKGGAPDGF